MFGQVATGRIQNRFQSINQIAATSANEAQEIATAVILKLPGFIRLMPLPLLRKVLPALVVGIDPATHRSDSCSGVL